MIYKQARFEVMDNTGALEVELIGALKKQKYACGIGNLIMVAVKRAVTKKKVKRGDVKQALIVQTKRRVIRYTQGYELRFPKNQVVIMGKYEAPLGTRLKGIVTQELRARKQVKTVTMSSYII
jgi:large subunit ribosomal protein L14